MYLLRKKKEKEKEKKGKKLSHSLFRDNNMAD